MDKYIAYVDEVHSTLISLRLLEPKNNQKSLIHRAEEYELDKRLKSIEP
jgi:hypothetical protein